MNSDQRLLCDASSVGAVVEAIRAQGRCAIDLEFDSAGKYIPELCLVQLAWGAADAPKLALVDAQQAPLQPIWDLVADGAITIVAHAAKQDLQLIATRFGVSAASLFDTQIGAAFCGLGDQIGYAKLVHKLLGVELDKSSQFTDWARRPLDPSQLRYALDDVRYLMTIHDRLVDKLRRLGREHWVQEECEQLASSAAERVEPDDAYRQVSGVGGLRGKALGSLRALASWRETLAVRDNLPPSWILTDAAMIEMCKRGVRTPHDAKKVRGVGEGTIRKYGADIFRVMGAGAETEPPAEVSRKVLSSSVQARAAVVNALIQSRCSAENIAARFVGTRSQADLLVECEASGELADCTDIALLAGWRREFIGADLVGWLSGELALVCASDGGLHLEPRSDVKSTS